MHFHFGQEHVIFLFLLLANKFGISRFIEDVNKFDITEFSIF